MSTQSEQSRGDLTFLFTDIEGSTRLWEVDPEGMRIALLEHDATIHAAVADHGGELVKSTGDGAFAAFSTATDGVLAALSIQRGLARAGDEHPKLTARMGLHTGAAVREGDDYFGPTVNRCARIADAGHGGQIVVSSTTRAQAEDSTLQFVDLGRHRLKDLAQPAHLFQVVQPGSELEFPPLRTLDRFPNNLPASLSTLVGRSEELTAVADLLDAHRLVTLTGAGGAGKTRLALQVAAERLEYFPSGVWLTDLGGLTDPALVPRAVTAAARVPDQPGLSSVEALAVALGSARALLVVDNCEHLIAAAASLVDRLLAECPDVRVLATSREALNVHGEMTWRVPSLALPASDTVDGVAASFAGALFLERATAVRPGYELTEQDAPAVAEICRRLDGLPLALELAAARARSLTPSEIADRLHDRFRILTGGARVALARQRTLEATVAWSYEMLDARDSTVFDRLAVFAGSFSFAAVETVAGHDLDPMDVLDALDGLIEKSLLDAEESDGQTRYRLLETMRAYGLEQLDRRGETADAHDRHLAWAAELAKDAARALDGPEQLAWLDRIELELDNFRAAMQWAVESHGAPNGLVIAARLYQYWYTRNVREGRAWLDRLLEQGPFLPPLEAGALVARAPLLLVLGEYEASADSARRALELHELFDDPKGRAYAEHCYGRAVWGTVPSETLREHFERSLELMRAVDYPVGIAVNLLFLGAWEGQYGSLAAARERADELLSLARSIGGQSLLAHALELDGMVEMLAGRGDARRKIVEAIGLYREIGNRTCAYHCLSNAAFALLEHGDPETAATLVASIDQLRAVYGVIVPLYEDLYTERVRQGVASALAPPRLEAARARGAALDADPALELAAHALIA